MRNLSKVTPPKPYRVHPTHRLFARLDQAADRPVTWIHGPPGAGKTTLAASYLAEKGIEPLWYRLDEGDADPATLFLYLAAAWQGRKIGLSLPLLTPEFRTALPLFTRRFFRGLFSCQKTSVVVFDDYHEVAAEAVIHQCMANGLEEVPKGARVIIVSRQPPPSALARLRLNGLIDVVEPDALKLSPGEAEGLARERGAGADAAQVARLVTQTQGWTAGLILMLEADADLAQAPTGAAGVPELLFEYFAGEILQRMGAPAERLLCMLAVMPTMTAAAAERLTESPEAGALLQDLRKRNYFTTRDNAAEPSYRFHPLFRDFLLECGRAILAAEDLRALRLRAAAVLDEGGQSDAAVDLLVAAEAFEDLAVLVKRRAASLLDEGRTDTLKAWLTKLPDRLKKNDAWLIYWSGAAILHPDPIGAYPLLGRAFDLFSAADDATGQFTAWSAQAEAVRVDAFGDQTRYDPLIAAMRALLKRYPEPQSDRIQLGIAMGMASGLSRRFNDRAEIAEWQKRARQAAASLGRPNLVWLADFMFAITDLQDANNEEALAALDRCPDPLTLDHLPITQASGLIAHAVARLYRQKEGDPQAFVEEALRRIEAAGYVHWTTLLASLALNNACARRDLEAARSWLRRATASADRVSSHRGAHYHGAAAYFHGLSGDLVAALSEADTAVALAIQSGWRFYICYARGIRAHVLIGSRAYDEARAELDRLDAELAIAATRSTVFPAGLLRAELLFRTGEAVAGDAALAAAFAVARSQRYRAYRLGGVLEASLCGRALRRGIESVFVRDYIKDTGLPSPDVDEELWPWPLKITTLGGFSVERDGEPLAFSRKTPKRLILLLKAIVAFGGRDVAEDKLVDALWPDEDGDAAQSALKIAIHRLRQLLGEPGLITVKGGRIGFDPARTWLDIWSFERLLAGRKPDETEADHHARTARGLALYRGDFLAGDENLWWIADCRKRVRQRFARHAPVVAD